MARKDGWQRRALTIYLPLFGFLLVTLFPYYWMVVTSLKPNTELYDPRVMPLIVHSPTLQHYLGLLSTTRFLQWTINTLVVAAASTTISVVIGTLAAYPLSRLKFPGAGLMALAIAATYLVPQTTLFIPLAGIVSRLGLVNTLWSIILAYPTFLIPFCAWLMMGYFKTIPLELEEAARIDGAGRFVILLGIVLPLSVPGLVSATIFAFTLSQNEFLYALIFLTRNTVRTVPVGAISELIRGDVFYMGQLMSAAVLGSIPVVFIYSFFVERYVAGLTAGALKG